MRRFAQVGTMVLVMSGGVLAPGCATIVDGTDQRVPITSNPPGASVTVDGGSTCATPTDLKLSRREEHTLLIAMPGYHTERVSMKRELSGAIFGNILLGGVVGGVADLASGASHHLEPKEVQVAMTKIKPGEQLEVREWAPPAKEGDAKKGNAEASKVGEPRGE